MNEHLKRSAMRRLAPVKRPYASAAQDVSLERERQKAEEGWTAEHDDAHTTGDLARAAAAYAMSAAGMMKNLTTLYPWPWDYSWWKPMGARRDLVRAGALILAEIERIDRAALTPSAGDKS